MGGLFSALGFEQAAGPTMQAKLDPQALAQQQAFIQALQQQQAGVGPNLGQAQLAAGQTQAMNQAAALAASQKGISPSTAARQALQAQADISQKAANQAAQLRAEQQLAAQQQLGQQLALQQQQALGQQQIQAGLAGQQAQAQGNILGGLFGGLGALGAGLAKGATTAAPAVAMAEGGEVDHEEVIPGKAKVKGDSLKNDTVPAMLSPGEIVIPRSIAQHENAPELAKRFVEEVLKKKAEPKSNYFDGEQVAAQDDIMGKVMQGVTEPATFDKALSHIVSQPTDTKYSQLLQAVGPEKTQELVKQGLVQQPPPYDALKQLQQEVTAQKAKEQTEQISKILGQPYVPAVPQAPAAPQMQVAPQVTQAPQDIFGYGATLEALQKGLKEQKAGITQEAEIAGLTGGQQAEALKTYQDQLKTRQNDFETNTQDIRNKIGQVSDDLVKSKIDPNRYLGDMSTMGKISTAIGLVLGGVGGGLQRTGKNAALDVLNAQIDRDIQAQKVDIDKKNTLLSAYYKELGNMREAENMTRLTMGDMLSKQLSQIADQNAGSAAGARALQMKGQIDTQNAQLIGQMSARKTLMGDQTGAVSPENKIRAFVPENQQKDYYKELQDLQNSVSTRDAVLKGFDEAASLNTLAGRTLAPWETKKRIDQIKARIIPGLSKETAGRFTEQDAGMIERMFDTLGENPEDIAKVRRDLDSLAKEKMHFPMLKTLGISPEQFSRYKMGGEKKIQLGAPVIGGK